MNSRMTGFDKKIQKKDSFGRDQNSSLRQSLRRVLFVLFVLLLIAIALFFYNKYTHYECRKFKCDLVFGKGEDICDKDVDCEINIKKREPTPLVPVDGTETIRINQNNSFGEQMKLVLSRDKKTALKRLLLETEGGYLSFNKFLSVFNIELPETIREAVASKVNTEEQYTLFSYKENSGENSLGFMIDLDKRNMEEVLTRWEEKIFEDLKSFFGENMFVSKDLEIQTTTYKDIKVYYFNIAEEKSLDYAVVDGKLVVASSKNSMLEVIDRILSFAESKIKVNIWEKNSGTVLQTHAIDPFEKETGANVVVGNFNGMDQFFSRVKLSFPPGGEFNIAHLSSVDDYARYVDLGFGADLDVDKIPNFKNVMSKMVEPLRKINRDKISAVPYDIGQTGIAYNTDYIDKEYAEKMGVRLLWDKKFQGEIASRDNWRPNIWYGALYTGQDPNNIQDMDAVWSALREQQNLIRKHWATGSEFMQLMANEEVYVSVAWSGRVHALQEQGYPIGWLAPKDTYSWMEYMFVFKGTDMDLAHKLLNHMLKPETMIAVAEGQSYPPSLDPKKVEIPESIKKMPAFDPTGKLENYTFADARYWSAHQKEWSEKWRKGIRK